MAPPLLPPPTTATGTHPKKYFLKLEIVEKFLLGQTAGKNCLRKFPQNTFHHCLLFLKEVLAPSPPTSLCLHLTSIDFSYSTESPWPPFLISRHRSDGLKGRVQSHANSAFGQCNGAMLNQPFITLALIKLPRSQMTCLHLTFYII